MTQGFYEANDVEMEEREEILREENEREVEELRLDEAWKNNHAVMFRMTPEMWAAIEALKVRN
jgi:hypothetical protein